MAARVQCFLIEMDEDKLGGFHYADGSPLPLGPLPPGAMWYGPHSYRPGPDGRTLMVVLPNGNHWNIDVLASNCTRRGEAGSSRSE